MTKDQIKLATEILIQRRHQIRMLLESGEFADNVQEFEMDIDDIDECAAALSRLTPTDL